MLAVPALRAAAQQSAGGPVFELSPFEVNTAGDRGYTATASLAGGRLSTELRDTAASVTVFTPELLADLGVTNFLEAARWAPSSVAQEEIDGGNLYNDYAVNFRGLGVGFQSRNYFRWYINSDAYNTERLEFSRGPNSLVFGDAGVGGVGNVSSKQARGTGAVSIEGQLSSYGGQRATVDADFKVTDTLSARAALLYQDFDDWRDIGGDQREGAFLTLTWRPTPRTSLRAEGEYGRLHRVLTYNTLDRFSKWDGVTTNPGYLGPRDKVPATLVRRPTTYLAFMPGRPDLGILDLQGFAQTDGITGRGLLTGPQPDMPDFAVIPTGDYGFSLQAPDGGVRNPYHTASIFLNHRVGDSLFLELAANYQKQERDITRWFYDQVYVDVNETLPGGIPNPYLGDYYGWARYWSNLQSNEVYDVRASLAYLVQTSITDQRLLLVGGQRHDRFEDDNHERVRVNGSNKDVRNTVNRIYALRYLGDGPIPNSPPPDLDPVSGVESRVARTTGFFSEKPITYLQAAASGAWLEDRRLHTLAGIRRDHYQERKNDAALDVRDAVSRELLAFGPRITTDKQDVTSLTLSGVYQFTEELGLSAGYSESFDPGSTARAIDGRSIEPLINNGKEVGLKYLLFNKRVSGSLVYYESEQDNNRIAGQSGPINEIWALIGSGETVESGYQDRQSNAGHGWELDLTAMPTDNWRIILNISFPETEIQDGMEDTRAYYEKNVAAWNAAADALEAGGQSGNAAAVRSRVAAIDNAIESVTRGRRLNNSFDYISNLFTRYFFTEGAMAGFSVGGGVNLRGRRLVGNAQGDPYDYILADGYEVLSALLGYDCRLRGGDLSVQLNINNLLDKEIVRPATSLGYTVQDPRQFLLTVRYAF